MGGKVADMTKILVEDIERFIPITSVWETVGGCEEIFIDMC
jgi:hypothetical protein